MLNIRARSVVQTFVDMIFANKVIISFSEGSLKTRGLIFSFHTRISDPSSGSSAATIVHIMVVGNHYAFGAIGNNLYVHTEWKNLGNHDSCWIDAVESFLSEQYFKLCESVNPDVAPANLHQQSWFANSLRPALVTMVQDPSNKELSDAKKIESVQRIDMTEFNQFTLLHSTLRS